MVCGIWRQIEPQIVLCDTEPLNFSEPPFLHS